MRTLVLTAEGDGFPAPSARDFVFPDIAAGVTKPMVLAVLAAVVVAAFFLLTSRKRAVVPGRLQFVGESVYGFVRNSIGRDAIGSKEFRPFVPLLVTLFCFILVNNWFGIIPLIQFPTMSRVGFPYMLAAIVWVVYNWVGIRRQGFVGYVKLQTWPAGVPAGVRLILTPLEFVSNILVRPVTLSMRLFANMFAGHLLLLVFILGGEYMLLHGSVLVKAISPLSFAMGIALSFFELFVQFIQAYIFTLLTALYIGGALAEEH